MREALTALAGVLAIPALAATPAAAAPDHGVLASYHGRTIDLGKSWQGARACVQVKIGDVRCFDSRTQMHDAVPAAVLRTVEPATTCGGSSKLVMLFSGTNWSGQELDFQQTIGWSNLADYGFDNTMESWANQKTCNAFLADGTGGGGDRLTLGPGAYSLDAGSWKNKASSANVAP